MFGLYNTQIQEYDQDDEERLVYEASYQECRNYMRLCDSDLVELYPTEEALEDEELTIEMFEEEEILA